MHITDKILRLGYACATHTEMIEMKRQVEREYGPEAVGRFDEGLTSWGGYYRLDSPAHASNLLADFEGYSLDFGDFGEDFDDVECFS